MARKVNSTDVANLAGVSQATVSYVLNKRDGQVIREETRLRVLRAASKLGYQPNHAARALVTGRTGMIALWVPVTHHSVFNHVIEQIMRLAHQSSLHVIVVQSKTETTETLSETYMLSPSHVDAILAYDATALVDDLLKLTNIPPIVSFGPAYSVNVDHVGVDLYSGSVQAVRKLYEIGRKRIAYAGYHKDLVPGDSRFDAYISVVKENNACPEIIPLDQGDYTDSYCNIKSYITELGAPDGLFCWNDEAAVGAIRACADLKLRIPDDIAIIGIDGIREVEFSVPSLTTMAQPFEEMCATAWQFLLNRLKEPVHELQAAILPMKLIERESTCLGRKSN